MYDDTNRICSRKNSNLKVSIDSPDRALRFAVLLMHVFAHSYDVFSKINIFCFLKLNNV